MKIFRLRIYDDTDNLNFEEYFTTMKLLDKRFEEIERDIEVKIEEGFEIDSVEVEE